MARAKHKYLSYERKRLYCRCYKTDRKRTFLKRRRVRDGMLDLRERYAEAAG
jgi:hypothetical protein